MKPFEVIQGSGAIILGQPHGGTWLPDTLLARLNENGRKLADTDWHIGRLYDGLLPNITIVRSNVHRYAIDATKLETDLGWKARDNFETGIKKTVRWYLDNEAWWRPLRDRYDGGRLGVLKN